MQTIDIDFDVFKALTARRTSEQVTHNDVLRVLLRLPPAQLSPANPSEQASGPDWIAKGVRFPVGTEFRARYKGKIVTGHVDAGALLVNGERFDSPSAAAISITGNSVNGWAFWECRIPGKSSWQLLKSLRQ